MSGKPKLYALSTCIHCRNTRQFLDDSDVEYDCVYIDKLTDQEREDIVNEVKKYNPAVSFPTLVYGDRIIVGFKKDEIKEMLGL